MNSAGSKAGPALQEGGHLLHRWPLSLTYFCSTTCNVACKHCNVSRGQRLQAGPGRLGSHASLLRTLKARGYTHVVFTGGEPTLYPGLAQDLQDCRDLELTPVLFSNGYVLPDSLLEILARVGGRLVVSLQGTREVHDDFVRRPSAYDRAMSALERSRALGIPREVNTSVGRWNASCLLELSRSLEPHGLRRHVLLFTSRLGDAAGTPELVLDINAWEAALEVLRQVRLAHELYAERMALTLEEWGAIGEEERQHTGCTAELGCRLCLDHEGRIATCPIRACAPEAWTGPGDFDLPAAVAAGNSQVPGAAGDCPAHAFLALPQRRGSAGWIQLCPFYLQRIAGPM